MTRPTLTSEQEAALIAFAARHGRRWRSILAQGWERAAYPGPLQEIRNQFGPSWLADWRLPQRLTAA
jgi:hypothetical protein